MKWLGGLLGAVAGPVLVVVVFLVLYNPPGHDNWDFITPVLFLAAIPMAVVFGAGGGAILGGRLSEGRQRDAVYTGLSTVGIITLLPLAVLFGFPLYFAVRGSPEFVPADEDDRQEWAAYQQGDRDDGYNPDGLEEGAGLALDIADCMRSGSADLARGVIGRGVPYGGLPDDDTLVQFVFFWGGCPELRKTWAGLSPDSLALLGAYTVRDKGWRWKVMWTGDSNRVLVFSDPLLEDTEPIYQVTMPWIAKAKRRGAPFFAQDRTVLRAVATYRCFVDGAAALRRDGRWDGEVTTLAPLIASREPAAGCPPMKAENLTLFSADFSMPHDGYPTMARMRYVAFQTDSGSSFQLHFAHDGWHYMVDGNGEWHMENGRPALPRDPPPPRCFFDHAIPCG